MTRTKSKFRGVVAEGEDKCVAFKMLGLLGEDMAINNLVVGHDGRDKSDPESWRYL
jgi:hypothetical protein